MTLYLDNKAAAFEISTTTVSSAITLLVGSLQQIRWVRFPLPWALTKDLSVLKVIMWAKIKWNYRLLFLLPKNWKSHRQSVNLKEPKDDSCLYHSVHIGWKKIEQYIKLSPQIAFAVELTDNGFFLKDNLPEVQATNWIFPINWKEHWVDQLREIILHKVAFGEMAPTIALSIQREFIYLQKVHAMSRCVFPIFQSRS